MRELTDAEKQDIWREVREEFPDDETMQEVHYVRLLHHRQTEGLSTPELLSFYSQTRRDVGSGSRRC